MPLIFQLKKEWRKLYNSKIYKKKTGLAIITSDGGYYRVRIIRIKKNIMYYLRGQLFRKTAILNMYLSNNNSSKY